MDRVNIFVQNLKIQWEFRACVKNLTRLGNYSQTNRLVLLNDQFLFYDLTYESYCYNNGNVLLFNVVIFFK